MNELLCVHSVVSGPRLQYVLDVLFHHIWKKEYRLFVDAQEFRQQTGPKIMYGTIPLEKTNALFIPASGFLENASTEDNPLVVGWKEDLPLLFPKSPYDGLPFDIFSAIFFMLSRWEEYRSGPKDEFGRFPAKSSMAYKHGFLHRPIVQEWAEYLNTYLLKLFPDWKVSKLPYSFQPTFDVDQAWAYRCKSSLRQLGGICKDALNFNFKSLLLRREVLTGHREDPFFTFADIESWHRKADSDPIFFFHLGDYGALDKNISPNHPLWRELIRRLDGAHKTGLHPSWKAGENPQQLELEIERFTKITGNPPKISRQHYLRLALPQTYRMLLDHGIKQDFTMGYADVPGFRAGISIPFPWYDLQREQKTDLVIYPFAVMDVTLKQYLQLQPAEGLKIATALMRRVRNHGGMFSTLWHNSSFSELDGWKPWRDVYIQLKILAEAGSP